ncbi:helix-turn-helix domain-containing protein [Lichenihabitans psoromatis]|uniref:helix-turn-helix domain-containing protein n=1 Tax=Lichenihabitans psoromatis TaxID=2528642 RepID=UPI0010385CF8|nr:helix-turn-helix domain-containing protein [Lichenihabitans psoromatis]
MEPVQIRMARAGLNISVDDLASRAGVSHVDVLNLETGETAETSAFEKIKTVFDTAGIEWIGQDGVRCRSIADASATIPLDKLNSYNDE